MLFKSYVIHILNINYSHASHEEDKREILHGWQSKYNFTSLTDYKKFPHLNELIHVILKHFELLMVLRNALLSKWNFQNKAASSPWKNKALTRTESFSQIK